MHDESLLEKNCMVRQCWPIGLFCLGSIIKPTYVVSRKHLANSQFREALFSLFSLVHVNQLTLYDSGIRCMIVYSWSTRFVHNQNRLCGPCIAAIAFLYIYKNCKLSMLPVFHVLIRKCKLQQFILGNLEHIRGCSTS